MNGISADSWLPSRRRAALLAILLVAAALRFWGLPEKSLFHFDEGLHAKEALHSHAVLRFWMRSAVVAAVERATGRQVWTKDEAREKWRQALATGASPSAARPFLTTPAALLMFLLPQPGLAIVAFCALMGCLSVWAVYGIGKEMAGPRLGLLAAAALATSGYHVIYSRLAFAETPSTAMFLFGVWTMTRHLADYKSPNRNRLAFLTGLFWGLAITGNDRWLLWVALGAVAFAAELAARAGRDFWKDGFPFAWRLCLGCAIGPLVFEAGGHAEFLLSRRLGVPFTESTYLEQLTGLLGMQQTMWAASGGAQAGGSSLPVFPYLFSRLTGVSPLLLALAGSVFAVRRRRPGWALCLTMAFGPFVFFSFFTHVAARFFVISIPFLSLLGAEALEGMFAACGRNGGKARRTRAIAWGIAILVFAEQTARVVPLVRLDAGYKEAVARLREWGDPKHISTQAHVTGLYAGLENTAFPPASLEELRHLYETGFRRYAVDIQALFGGFGGGAEEKLQVVRAIQRRGVPAARVPNPAAGHFLYWFEHNFGFAETRKAAREARNGPWSEIAIYDLDQFFRSADPGDRVGRTESQGTTGLVR
ncbi:MAG: glycosyltransferase family 39 protein [Candidatus Sumerlaeota bacterium]|nr:glycosyltransferase family 39 protein [Candidatus Sumerlaeota bacterium]